MAAAAAATTYLAAPAPRCISWRPCRAAAQGWIRVARLAVFRAACWLATLVTPRGPLRTQSPARRCERLGCCLLLTPPPRRTPLSWATTACTRLQTGRSRWGYRRHCRRRRPAAPLPFTPRLPPRRRLTPLHTTTTTTSRPPAPPPPPPLLRTHPPTCGTSAGGPRTRFLVRCAPWLAPSCTARGESRRRPPRRSSHSRPLRWRRRQRQQQLPSLLRCPHDGQAGSPPLPVRRSWGVLRRQPPPRSRRLPPSSVAAAGRPGRPPPPLPPRRGHGWGKARRAPPLTDRGRGRPRRPPGCTQGAAALPTGRGGPPA